jgi:hypothetical protein
MTSKTAASAGLGVWRPRLAGPIVQTMRAHLPVGLRSVLIALTLSWSCGCARKAPGPAECQRFALQVTGVRDARALSIPRVKAEVDDWTRRCLTTPYDRELLACVDRGEAGCYQRFALREPAAARRDVAKLER